MKNINHHKPFFHKILLFLGIFGVVIYLRQTTYVGQSFDGVLSSEEGNVSIDSLTSLANMLMGQAEMKNTPTPKPPSPTPTPKPTPEPADQDLERRIAVDDISTHDPAEFLPDMPTDDEDIVKRDSDIYTYEQMVKDLYFLDLRYPGCFTTSILGTTADGRAIYEVMLGSYEADRHVLVQYSIHAREYINTLLAMCQLEAYLKDLTAGASYQDKPYEELFSTICIHMIPNANPDGIAISQFGPDGLRTQAAKDTLNACYEFDKANGRANDFETYCRRFKANANGVDLNKNFDVGWDIYTGGPLEPSYEGYHGTAAESEAETQAILSVTDTYPVIAVISYHSEGDIIFWNYELEDETLLAQDKQLADNLEAITGYTKRISKKYNASLSGGCSDYYVWMEGRIAVTVETGQDICPININVFPKIWTANKDLLPMLATLYG